jgi:hypothetical protein
MKTIERALQRDGLQPGEIVAVTYIDGDIIEGQPNGEGWSVTKGVYRDFDVYHRGVIALDELEEALSATFRTIMGISDEISESYKDVYARMIDGTSPILGWQPVRLKLTETGMRNFKPRSGVWAMTVLHNRFEVYHQPGMTEAELLQALDEALVHDPNWHEEWAKRVKQVRDNRASAGDV